jgi:hypothetical protein
MAHGTVRLPLALQRAAHATFGSALFLACVWGCIPGDHSLIGAPCDGMDQCPSPLFCVGNACAAAPLDAGVRNLLSNPGFEQGLIGWEPFNTDSNLAVSSAETRSGQWSGLASNASATDTTDPQYGVASHALNFDAAMPLGVTYCGQIWVSAGPESQGIPAFLSLLVKADGGNIASAGGAASPPDGGWALMTASMVPDAGEGISLRVLSDRTPNRVPLGAGFFVDDAALWIGDGGDCSQGP